MNQVHQDAEELREEQLHGVPDVEHKMKKVFPRNLTLCHLLNISMTFSYYGISIK